MGVRFMANTPSGKFEPNDQATIAAARKGGQRSPGDRKSQKGGEKRKGHSSGSNTHHQIQDQGSQENHDANNKGNQPA